MQIFFKKGNNLPLQLTEGEEIRIDRPERLPKRLRLFAELLEPERKVVLPLGGASPAVDEVMKEALTARRLYRKREVLQREYLAPRAEHHLGAGDKVEFPVALLPAHKIAVLKTRVQNVLKDRAYLAKIGARHGVDRAERLGELYISKAAVGPRGKVVVELGFGDMGAQHPPPEVVVNGTERRLRKRGSKLSYGLRAHSGTQREQSALHESERKCCSVFFHFYFLLFPVDLISFYVVAMTLLQEYNT